MPCQLSTFLIALILCSYILPRRRHKQASLSAMLCDYPSDHEEAMKQVQQRVCDASLTVTQITLAIMLLIDCIYEYFS